MRNNDQKPPWARRPGITRFIYVILAAAIIGVLAGCTGSGSSPAPATPVAEQAATAGLPVTDTPAADAPPAGDAAPARLATVAEAEQLAGFDLLEPGYLPEGVSFDFAMLESAPGPYVTLQYKIVHPQYGDMGAFFQILQQPQPTAPLDVTTCSGSGDGVCELLQIGGATVIYHRYTAGTEGLDWYANGVVLRLLRTAGEPGKSYKDELVKVVESMK